MKYDFCHAVSPGICVRAICSALTIQSLGIEFRLLQRHFGPKSRYECLEGPAPTLISKYIALFVLSVSNVDDGGFVSIYSIGGVENADEPVRELIIIR